MEYIITSSRKPTKREIKQIDKIVLQNHFIYGGQLQYKNLIHNFDSQRDVVVMAKQNNQCIGFAYIKLYSNSIYIAQIAVANDFKNKGVGSTIIGYIKKHSLGFKEIASHINKSNETSLQFHIKNGFEEQENEETDRQYFLTADVQGIANRTDFRKNVKEEIITMEMDTDLSYEDIFNEQ